MVTASPGVGFTAPLSGTGQPPVAVRLEPAVFNFPSVSLLAVEAPSFTFTLTNDSATVLGPWDERVSGSGRNEFLVVSDDCQGSLLPGSGTCHIQVQFQPRSLGAKTATLEAAVGGLVLTANLGGAAR
jgi:hypothetical protein